MSTFFRTIDHSENPVRFIFRQTTYKHETSTNGVPFGGLNFQTPFQLLKCSNFLFLQELPTFKYHRFIEVSRKLKFVYTINSIVVEVRLG